MDQDSKPGCIMKFSSYGKGREILAKYGASF